MPHNAIDWSIFGVALLTLAAVVFAVWQVFFGPRILSLLVFRYLRKRRIAWVSLIAVILCTMMVIVVISVMGGWLRMFRETNHGLIGDISVFRNGMYGFDHYEELIDDILKVPGVKGAAPEVHTFGLMHIMKQNFENELIVVGVDMSRIGKVNGFLKSLHLTPDELNAEAEAKEKKADELSRPGAKFYDLDDAQRLRADAAAMRRKATTFPSFDKILSDQSYRDATPKARNDAALKLPGLIVGSGVIGLQENDDGTIDRPDIMYRDIARLSLLISSDEVSVKPDDIATRDYWIVDDSKTGVFLVDQNTVYVPFGILQKDMGMDGADGSPARCNEINIGLNDPTKIDEIKPAIQKVVSDFETRNGMHWQMDPLKVQTWEERRAEILSAVEHEEGILVILFAIISIVAVFLIFCIFFMIVMEKTRDIGIIKSIGVTSNGVAGIFLGYGLAIGIVGGGLGMLGGWAVIHYINQLHKELGKLTGLKIWDARTYVFDKIPNTVDPKSVILIVSIAILASVIGALVPAIRAARMNPVEALRWE